MKMFEITVTFHVQAESAPEAELSLSRLFDRDEYAGHTDPVEVPTLEESDTDAVQS